MNNLGTPGAAPPRDANQCLITCVEVLTLLQRECDLLFAEAQKEVAKCARAKLDFTVRQTALGADLVAWHVGSYLQSTASYDRLFSILKEHDDAERIAKGMPIRTYDGLWDQVAGFLLTYMRGYCDKRGLVVDIPAGSFVSLF